VFGVNGMRETVLRGLCADLNCHLYSRVQSVPRSKHYALVIETSRLMFHREIMTVCSEIPTKHINTVSGQNVELMNVKLAVHIVTTIRYIYQLLYGTYIDHCAVHIVTTARYIYWPLCRTYFD